MSAAHQQALKTHWALLMEILDVSNLLLTELNAENVLDRRTKQEIMSNNIKDDINQRFLEWLNQSPSSTFDICLQKLRDDGQKHIANLLDDTSGERPLERSRKLIIRRNSRCLSKLIDVTETSGLIDCLWSKRVLNDRDRQRIQAETVIEDRALKLLDIICTKSDRAFDCMIEALKETNQQHIIPVFLTETGHLFAANVKFKSTSAPEMQKQFEEQLAQIIGSAARQMLDREDGPQEEKIEAVKEKLKEICHENIKLIGAKTNMSITIYLLCETVESMVELLKVINSRHFEKILEDIYSPLKTSMGMKNVTTTVSLTDEDLQFLKGISKEMVNLSENFPSREEVDTSEIVAVAERTEVEILVSFMKSDYLHMKKEKKEMIKEQEKLRKEHEELKKKHNAAEVESNALKQKLKSTEADLSRYIARSQMKQFHQIDSRLTVSHLLTKEEVVGVTWLLHRIYILCNEIILAFENYYPYCRSKEDDIEISEIKIPCDIAACHRTKCLFVTDSDNRCIWQVELNGRLKFRWLEDVREPYLLSISSVGHVLVPQIEPSCIMIYDSSSGKFIREISFNQNWMPIHAVETSSRTVIVSCIDNTDVTEEYKIFEINEIDCIVHQFESFSPTCHVYLTAGTDVCMFAANKDWDAVVCFDRHWECEILNLDKDDTKGPWKVCYMKETHGKKVLIVLHYKEIENGVSPTVSVYTLPNTLHCVIRNC